MTNRLPRFDKGERKWLSIATNLGALSASKAASGVQSSMEVSMARLASGKRINSAADDSGIGDRVALNGRG